ncbi:hypothetical protein NKH57_23645 [Mesorhizobium sp. M1050]|uniref:hypothetical protein n=1 Tax=unclassified Mesorhizobium TaxID=325217 RepID=UPI0003CE9DA4|nr:hypothetical protein [Mesorhizobium sp. LNHC252B00]ESY71282.1 hypothetical protein X743_22265 [Mesorhizobium sp. LNHC252B00]
MSDSSSGISPAGAFRLEVFIIGLGVLALVLIFQPFSIGLYAVGSGLVVLAGLVNNLLPLAEPGVKPRSVVKVALVVAMIFCIVLLVSMTVAHLYGAFFLKPPDPNTIGGKAQLATPPFYKQVFVWEVAAATVILAAIVTVLNKTTR